MSPGLQIPSFITHYNRSEPFRSVTQSPQEMWPDVVQLLTDETSWGIRRFSDPEYLVQRLEVEKRIRNEFITKGGRPELKNPIYFFLGRNIRFEEHPGNKGYAIELRDINSDSISFTYGDSMLAYIEKYRNQSGEKYRNSLCAKVYRMDELKSLFAHPSFPPIDSLAVEVQLWRLPWPEVVRLVER
jgi:hypothetical protein